MRNTKSIQDKKRGFYPPLLQGEVMGEANQVGFISGISINQQDLCVFILLLPSIPSSKINNNAYTLLNENNIYGYAPVGRNCSFRTNPCEYFNPIALPIFGKYNNAGSFSDYIPDHNTKIIENYFGCDVPIIIKQIEWNHTGKIYFKCKDQSVSNIFYSLSGVFEHKKIFSDLISLFKKEYIAKNSTIEYKYKIMQEFWKGQKETKERYEKLKKVLYETKDKDKEMIKILKQLESGQPKELLIKIPDMLPFGEWDLFKRFYYDILLDDLLSDQFKAFELFIEAMKQCNKGFILPFKSLDDDYKFQKKILQSALSIIKDKEQ